MPNFEPTNETGAMRQLARAKIIEFVARDAPTAEILSNHDENVPAGAKGGAARESLLALGSGDHVTSSAALGALAREGWSRDLAVVWSDSTRSTMRFRVDETQAFPLAAALDLVAFLSAKKSQTIILYSGAEISANVKFDAESKRRLVQFDIPPSAKARDGTVHLAIEILEATSPLDLGLSTDDRKLGVALLGLELK